MTLAPLMTILPQAPEHITASAGIANSTNSFSPSAGVLVRVCVTWLKSTPLLGDTFTCKDSNNVSYAATVAGNDSNGQTYLLIFDHVYAAAPGAITVTITNVGDTAAADCLLERYLITGQSSDQSTAAKNSVSSGTSTSNCQISLTTTKPGSLVFFLGAPTNTNHPVPTGINGAITDAEWADDTVGAHGIIGRSRYSTETPGPTTFGWTLSTTSATGFGAVASEVVPASAASGPYIQSLVDNFNDNSLNTSVWSTPSGMANITESGQKLNLGDTTGYPTIVGMGGFDLKTGIQALRYYPSGAPSLDSGGNGTNFHIGVQDGPGNTASVKAWANGDAMAGVSAGGATISSVIGDSLAFFSGWTSGNWLGIGNIDASGKVHIYKSVDGQTWIEIASFVISGTFDKATCGVRIYSGHTTGTSTFVTSFDEASRFTPRFQMRIDSFDGSAVDASKWNFPDGIYPYTQTIVDNFDDNSFDTSIWTVSGAAGDITESNGQLQVAPSTNYSNASSHEVYDITKGFFATKLSHVGIIDNASAFLWFGIESGNNADRWAVQAYLEANSWNGFNQLGTVGAITGNQTAFSTDWVDGNWLGWGNIGPDKIMHIYKSTDAETWTEIASVAYSGGDPALSACAMTIGAAEDSGTTTYKAQFDTASYFANTPDIIESGGKLQLSSVGQYPNVSSKARFDITKGILAVKVSQSGTPISSSELYVGVRDIAGNGFDYLSDPAGAGFFDMKPASGSATTTSSGIVTGGVDASWNADDWLGIGMSGSIATAYKSPDGQTWTELGHCTIGGSFDKTATGISMMCGNFGTVSCDYKALFDDPSFFASALPIKVRVSGAWVNAVMKIRVNDAWVDAVPKVKIAGAWATPK